MCYNIGVKKAAFFVVLGLVLACGLSAGAGGQTRKRSPKDLPPQHRKWLEEEVVYLITDKEKDVFLQLETDREREIFIEAFWRQRDPTPNTPKNEFKEEHYRRISYANQWYGRDAPGPGWRTDMGRIYIILGPPKSEEKHENLPEIYPTVIWFYDGMAEYRLPGSFSVVFFKKNGGHEYVLYSPIQDGPQNLLVHYKGDMTSHESAVAQLAEVSQSVAEVSLSLIPGEARFSAQPSLASQVLISAQIPAAPREKVKDDYAEKLLRYKDVIEVDYTANYFSSEALVRVYQDASGTAFIHFLLELEPRRLTVEEGEGGRYRGDFDLIGKVADKKGMTVYQFERRLPLEMSGDQLRTVRAKPFSYQDICPVIPGTYTFNVLLKNRLSREFTSLEAEVLVPDPGAFSMNAPVLANKVDRNSRYRGQTKSFLLGGTQVVPSPRNDFLAGETATLYTQLRNLPPDLKAGGTVEYTIVRESERAAPAAATEKPLVRSRPLAEYADPANIFEDFHLAGFSPSHYKLRVAVLDGGRREYLAAETRFLVSPMAALPRPWVLSLPLPPPGDASYAHILGLQNLAVRNLDAARRLLESAYRRDPARAVFALDYGRALAESGDYAGVKAVVQPFLADDRKWDFLQIAGEAEQALGEYASAVLRFKEYLAHFGANISVLNRVGDCYFQLDNPAEALVAWERSLQLDPNQPGIRDKVKALKKSPVQDGR
jgi:GWxTD domain-containing protein